MSKPRGFDTPDPCKLTISKGKICGSARLSEPAARSGDLARDVALCRAFFEIYFSPSALIASRSTSRPCTQARLASRTASSTEPRAILHTQASTARGRATSRHISRCWASASSQVGCCSHQLALVRPRLGPLRGHRSARAARVLRAGAAAGAGLAGGVHRAGCAGGESAAAHFKCSP